MQIRKQEFIPKQQMLCVGGSPRKGGNTDCILETFASEFVKRKVETDVIKLRDYDFKPCVGCERCRKNNQCAGHDDAMQLLYPKIVNSKGLILVSPTHHYNITSWMKAFIDRMYCFYRFGNDVPRSWSSRLAGQGRIAAVVAICEQEEKKDMGFTLEAMRWPLEAFGYEIIDELAVYKIFKKAGVKQHPDVIARVKQISDKIVTLLKRV